MKKETKVLKVKDSVFVLRDKETKMVLKKSYKTKPCNWIKLCPSTQLCGACPFNGDGKVTLDTLIRKFS